MKVRFSYLREKFHAEQSEKIWARMKETVLAGDFTVSADRKAGREVYEFEKTFAKLMGVKYAVGVANGTDALELSLWAAGVRAGDEVIAPANTFVASLGAIGNLQAKPVLVDVGINHVINPDLIEDAITPKTKAIMPVHFSGAMCDMSEVLDISMRHRIPIIEDACQAYLATYGNHCAGTWGLAGAFSLHPLKILNVWGDGGVITTDDENLYEEIKLLQNHGMATRDNITKFPCRNSRLDAIHAAVANAQILETPGNVEIRRKNAAYYDSQLKYVVHINERSNMMKSVYHLYFVEVNPNIRDDLYHFLNESGVEAKIHYKTPLYLQPGLASLGYRRGDFPEADSQCASIITLPVDELVTQEMQDYVILKIKEFMANV